ncbi:hypothetical protein N5U14_02670 [Aliarcobacter butzleri]|uniref:hypothetical protein n=1 Tax=Aliarcobacter butzleri TaxID=28197 RepID=UPI0021B26935|nr:hypothetical protein [Aliarcobacter butzleri]MCT7609742.1 hypothetical protein [Aliarcobacter butzleri]
MYKKIFIILIFIITIFSGCSTKNNISKKEDYKTLDEVSILAIKDTNIKYHFAYTTAKKCTIMSDKYFNDIMNVNPLIELLKNKSVNIKYTEATKKLLVIRVKEYISELNNDCKPSKIVLKVELYDVEDISKNWNKDNMKNYIKDIKALDDKRLIYSQSFILDENYNNYSELSYRVRGLVIIDNKDKKDINKFYQEVIKDLEKVMKFPQ